MYDRSDDADWCRELLRDASHPPVVPGRRNRLIPPGCDKYVYRSRHLIENAFARLESAPRIATRYEKIVTAYAAFVSLASGLCDFEDIA